MILKNISFLLFSTACTTFCFGQHSIKKDTLLQVIGCGPDGANIEHPRKVASLKFGFKYIYVDSLCCPGCKDKVYGHSKLLKPYNDSIFKIIAGIHGLEWEVNYGKELNRLTKVEKDMQEFLIARKLIRGLPKTFAEDLEDRKFQIWVDETEEKNKFNVSVLSWLKNVKPHWNIVYDLLVDTNEKSIKVLSKKTRPL